MAGVEYRFENSDEGISDTKLAKLGASPTTRTHHIKITLTTAQTSPQWTSK